MNGQKGASLHGQDLLSVPWEKSTWAPPDAAKTQGSQHLKGRKIYSLPIFPLLLCLIKTTISLSHLLSGLSYRDPEDSCIGSFSLHPSPLGQNTLTSHPCLKICVSLKARLSVRRANPYSSWTLQSKAAHVWSAESLSRLHWSCRPALHMRVGLLQGWPHPHLIRIYEMSVKKMT